MDLMEKLQVFSEKLGMQTTVSVGNGTMLCTEGASAMRAASSLWKEGYWDNGRSWDHNAWDHHW